MTADTIFALSSGSPPAAIAIVRISGPAADEVLQKLAGKLPKPRSASLVMLRANGEELDRAIALRFPGPHSVTGEDVVELHLHGGRAVVAAILEALRAIQGLRSAEPGEFTRRAFESGRIDLAEAEGLADLLEAETQSQRRAALAMASGALSQKVDAWREQLLRLAAELEAVLDFSDEGEVGDTMPFGWHHRLGTLAAELEATLARPTAERLKDGIKVVIAGPPNAGKSSLLNALVGREAAITSATPGTTRDLVEAPIAISGVPFLLTDTAGLRESSDEIEVIGIDRARRSLASADVILWLGPAEEMPAEDHYVLVSAKSDLAGKEDIPKDGIAVSSMTGAGLDALVDHLVDQARALLPNEGGVTMNRRQAQMLAGSLNALRNALAVDDPLIVAELLREARNAIDRITGRAGVEDMLDALFGRFCIGK